MLYLILYILCILVSGFLLEVVILKGTAFIFKKRELTWRIAAIVTLAALPFAIGSSFLIRLGAGRTVIAIIYVFCILGLFIVPIILIKRSLRLRTALSIAIVVVATVASSIAGAGSAFAVRSYLVQAFRIPSTGMAPTLGVGDYMLANRLAFRLRPPRRGELVVFRYPLDTSKDFIKRVVAVGGDTVEIRDKKLLVNGKPYKTTRGPV